MNIKNFFIIITGFLAVFYCLNTYSKPIKLKSQTPMFDKPMGKVVYVLNKERVLGAKRKVIVKKEKFPFMRYISFFEVQLEAGAKRTAYVAPELEVKVSNNLINGRKQAVIDRRSYFNWNLAVPMIICVIACFYFIYFHFVMRKYKTGISIFILCVFLFFLRWVILAFTQGYPISTFCSATDEWAYFNGAKDIINLNFTNISKVSVGSPIYYIPFCFFWGQEDIYQVLMPISKFNGFILMPVITVMLFFIARKVTGSYRKSIIYSLLFSILPLLYHNYECWQELLFKSRFSVLPIEGYRLYKLYLSLGFNNLPDMPSFFVLMLLILCSVYGKKNYLYVILISFLFGLACLIRLNNMLMAPMVAMVFYFKFKEQYYDYKKLLIHVCIAVSVVSCVLGIQLAINYLSLGGLFACPYGQDEDISNINYIARGIKAMIGSNYLFVVLGVSGLVFQPNRKYRIIFALWTIPMVLFFATTKCISLSPYRYLIAILPGFLLSFFALPIWEKANKFELSVLLTSLIFSFIFVAPCGMAPFKGALPFDIQILPYGKTIAVVFYCTAIIIDLAGLFLLRNNKVLFTFLLFSLALFFVGNSFLIITVFVLIMLRTLVDIFYELLPLYKHLYAQISGKKNISC